MDKCAKALTFIREIKKNDGTSPLTEFRALQLRSFKGSRSVIVHYFPFSGLGGGWGASENVHRSVHRGGSVCGGLEPSFLRTIFPTFHVRESWAIDTPDSVLLILMCQGCVNTFEPTWMAIHRRFHLSAVVTLQWIRAELLEGEDFY